MTAPKGTHHEIRRRAFWRRMIAHAGISLGVLGMSLAIGVWGYRHFEHMGWRDALLNASMLLGGMGPVRTELTESGKVFASVYAIYCGVVVIAVTGLLLAPSVHRIMHRVHWDDRP